jgi:regulator of protease activity HflC (stomatin/prohibitin superfamily)
VVEGEMGVVIGVLVGVVLVLLVLAGMGVRVVSQFERGVVFRFGRVIG